MKMKKLFLYSTLIVVVAFFASCEEQDYSEMRPSVEVGVDVGEVTIFDTEFALNFTTSNPSISELAVKGGSYDGTVSIADQKGSVMLNESYFGDGWAAGEATSFSVTANFKSYQSVSGFSIEVVDATDAKVSSETIAEYDSAMVYLESELATMFKTIGSIKVETAIRNEANPDPVFTLLEEALNKDEFEHIDSIYGVDYAIGDTVLYKITATEGSHIEKKMVEVAVVTKQLPDEMKGELSVSSSEFAFMPMEDADDLGVVSFDDPRGFTSSEVGFVKITEGNQVDDIIELLEFSKLVSVVDAAMLEGTVADANIGDVYAFMYDYKDGMAYYGFLTVVDVHSAAIGDAENGISFVYRQDIKQ